MNNLPEFVEGGSEAPRLYTKDYWNRFKFSMLLHPSKIQVDQLLTKQQTNGTSLSTDELLNIQICKATFMMAIRDQAVKELHARNPKDDIFDKDLHWIKGKWEEAWKASEFINQSFVKTIQATREKSESMPQFWPIIAGLVAKIKIDSMTAAEMDNALQVATFTVGVNDDEMALHGQFMPFRITRTAYE